MTDSRTEDDLDLRHITGTMKIQRVEENTRTHLIALMREESGGYSTSSVEITSLNPVVLGRMENIPTPQLARAGLAATDDGDLARRIQTYIANLPRDNAFSGAILVAHEGRVVMNSAWGIADAAKKIRNTTDTQFCIASMGKMFTAVAVLQLVDQGRLALDDPIGKYWPAYPNSDLAHRVTIRQLLDHTGGTGEAFTPEFFEHRLEIHDPADYVRLLGHRPLRFGPGSRMEYSNYGFILLGRLIELVSGETYDGYVQKHIFALAGMKHTDLLHQASPGENRAIGYMHASSGLLPDSQILPWKGTPAGGDYSTANDLLQFARVVQSGKLVSRALMREATTNQAHYGGYGLGFMLAGQGSFGHAGGMPGVSGELLVLPRTGYVLIVLANRDPGTAENMVDFIRRRLPQPSG